MAFAGKDDALSKIQSKIHPEARVSHTTVFSTLKEGRVKNTQTVGGSVIKDSKVGTIAFIGNYLPRKCGIATFTSDLLAAVAAEHPASECFSVSVNDIKEGYEYPDVVRFEIEDQDLSSYLRAADFLNISNVDVVCLQHEFGIFGGP